MQTMEIVQIETPEEIDAVRHLVREFFAFALTEDPSAKNAPAFAGVDEQLAALPGIFGPPDGAFLLASVDGKPAGCVALRADAPGVCEVKRMYVRPDFRGLRVGKALVAALIETSRALGYRKIVLDTFHTFRAAQYLYRKAGFVEVPPTFDLPEHLLGKVVFMEMDLP